MTPALRFALWIVLAAIAMGRCNIVRASGDNPPAAAPIADREPIGKQLGIQYKVPSKEPSRAASTPHLPSFLSFDGELPEAMLPQVTITADRLKLTERELLSSKGRLEFAQKKYISPIYSVTFGPLSQIATYYYSPLSLFSGWHPNEAEAMTLYYEDDRRRILSEMDDLIKLETSESKKDSKMLKRLRLEVYQEGIKGLYWTP